MSKPNLAFAVSGGGDLAYLTVAGEIDLTTRDALISASIGALETTAARLEIDISQVKFCDSSGISGFLAIHRIAREHGKQAVLTNAPPGLARTLSVTGLDELLVADPTQS